MHRENYLAEPAFRQELAEFENLSPEVLQDLLEARDWRQNLVGIYGIICLRAHDFSEVLGNLLVNAPRPLIQRPLCLALAVLGGNQARGFLESFLRRPYQPDSAEEYAA